jgi:peptidylprolyl isomerase
VPAADRSPAGTFGTEPTVTVPPGAPPTQLETADLIVGTGATAKAGDSVTVQYVLATYSSGKVIQASWTSQPFTFELGAGQVIKGWDEGVVGMKVGGRRELIIPPSLGYGASAPPGASGIAANDTLVFVVDLLKIG